MATAERIIIRHGQPESSILLIAPHGPDDIHTVPITEQLADLLDCSCVINNGYVKADAVDYAKEEANCNNIKQIKSHNVVEEEFLEPILEMVDRMWQEVNFVNVFILHGMDNMNIAAPAFGVLGYGAHDKKPSYSCDLKQVHLLAYLLRQSNIPMLYGKANGDYAAWSKNNLNQLFRKWEFDEDVSSMQIELVRGLRQHSDGSVNTKCAHYLAKAINLYVNVANHWHWERNNAVMKAAMHPMMGFSPDPEPKLMVNLPPDWEDVAKGIGSF